ncbi:hypothetical protein CAEBREN_19892 [Caenorhabditis brenneri]|uniref:Uncharacterized protein n=1 Tax=Caenorhabditis brenneri TaxID=135651 RepID=G0PJM3_CAEBE|nr:hypothetical protein CAEBREN_19892 [Caenorhabditis brenneri]
MGYTASWPTQLAVLFIGFGGCWMSFPVKEKSFFLFTFAVTIAGGLGFVSSSEKEGTKEMLFGAGMMAYFIGAIFLIGYTCRHCLRFLHQLTVGKFHEDVKDLGNSRIRRNQQSSSILLLSQ